MASGATNSTKNIIKEIKTGKDGNQELNAINNKILGYHQSRDFSQYQ